MCKLIIIIIYYFKRGFMRDGYISVIICLLLVINEVIEGFSGGYFMIVDYVKFRY